MDRFDDDTLFAELRELRPTPRPEFAAELDERAAAGFPRGADTTAAVFAPVVDWWQGMTPRRRLMPALGFALVAVIVATGAVAIFQSGGNRLNVDENGGGEISALESTSGGESAQSAGTAAGTEIGGPGGTSSQKGGGATAHSPGGRSGHGIPEYEVEKNETAMPGASVGAAGAVAGGEEESGGGAEEAAAEEEVGAEYGAESSVEAAPSETTPKVKSAGGRDVERSSYIVLGTKPGEVAGAAAKVYEAVHAANGFVLSSSVQSGTTGATGASFELSIPTRKVDDALAAISSIAEVRERHDATNDITAPTVSAAEELADSSAAIEGLLKQLADVETEAEQESVEARLREERRHHAAIRASLDHLHQRASMSEVSVRIVTNHGAGVTPPSNDKGEWGVGDALHSAGHILTIAAGVVVIGLAILAPFALIGLLIWAANRFRVRRLRERTLG
jgi:Domain of unknown function (DUF4349)